MRLFLAVAALLASVPLAVPASAQDAFVAYEDTLEAAAAAVPPGAQPFPRLRTVLVGPVPGDPIASGTQLLNALASINPTSCPGDNWRLWIAPGVYDLGGSPLVMKPCVDIEGAGERATIITKAGTNSGGHCSAAAYTVLAASHTELRLLTIESINNGTSCALLADSASVKLAQVTLLASGTNAYGLSVANASLTLAGVTISAAGGFVGVGIDVGGSSLTLTDATVVAYGAAGDFAVSAGSSDLTIYRSRVAGTTQTAIYTNMPALTRVAHSQLEGGVSPGIACIGNYDANFAPVTCP